MNEENLELLDEEDAEELELLSTRSKNKLFNFIFMKLKVLWVEINECLNQKSLREIKFDEGRKSLIQQTRILNSVVNKMNTVKLTDLHMLHK